jgi:ABC-type transporter Mla subunit MlaD
MFPTRLEMEEKLAKAFTPEQTASLVEVLDPIRQAELRREADTQDLKRGLTELTGEVRKLAEAQRRTDEHVGELAEAQRRTDERLVELTTRTDKRFEELAEAQRHTDQSIGELAEAQRHTDKRVDKLAETMEHGFTELRAAQQRTDETVAQLSHTVQVLSQKTDERFNQLTQAVQLLAEKMDKGFTELRREVGSLANTFGFNLEEFVAALLPSYLEKHGGITNLTLERRYFPVNGGLPEEVDLASEGERAGQPVMVLAECRTTIGGSEIRRLAAKLDAVAATLADRDVFKIVVAMNVHPTAEEAARETGLWAIPYSRINRERMLV